jgi:hypothetical protein
MNVGADDAPGFLLPVYQDFVGKLAQEAGYIVDGFYCSRSPTDTHQHAAARGESPLRWFAHTTIIALRRAFVFNRFEG